MGCQLVWFGDEDICCGVGGQVWVQKEGYGSGEEGDGIDEDCIDYQVVQNDCEGDEEVEFVFWYEIVVVILDFFYCLVVGNVVVWLVVFVDFC